MPVVTIFNLKGGSAKTSTVAHVGQLLGLRGYRVLLIDLDSQASLTNLFGVTPELDPDMPILRSDPIRGAPARLRYHSQNELPDSGSDPGLHGHHGVRVRGRSELQTRRHHLPQSDP